MDYSETPDELEKKALAWLAEELPRYRSVTKRLAKEYHCEATPEAVEKHLVDRARLKPKDLLRVTNAMRKVIQEFVDEDVVRINKKYKTKVIETPKFLTGMLPTGRGVVLRHLHQEAVPALLPHDRPQEGPAKVGLPAHGPPRPRGVRPLRQPLEQRPPLRRARRASSR